MIPAGHREEAAGQRGDLIKAISYFFKNTLPLIVLHDFYAKQFAYPFFGIFP